VQTLRPAALCSIQPLWKCSLPACQFDRQIAQFPPKWELATRANGAVAGEDLFGESRA
jgi:hypothetical protein